MEIKTILTIAQIVVAVVLVIIILLQQRGEGLGSFFGGGGEVFRTRRGIENVLFYLTIVLIAVLVVLSITNTIMS